MLGKFIADSGGRRFTLVLGACMIYTLLFAFGDLTEGGYVTLQLATVGAYIAGNGAQKFIEKKYQNGT